MSDPKLYIEPISQKTARSDPAKYKTLQAFRSILNKTYGCVQSADKANVIIAIGGDGQMLNALHRATQCGARVFGIHAGDSNSRGALLNHYFKNLTDVARIIEQGKLPDELTQLRDILSLAQVVNFTPLRATGVTEKRKEFSLLGFNDVAFEHHIGQEARLHVLIQDKHEEKDIFLRGNGLVISTGVGSSAYNSNNEGPDIPFTSKMLAATSLSTSTRLRACYHEGTCFTVKNLEGSKRKTDMAVDNKVVRDILECVVKQSPYSAVPVLFNRCAFFQNTR